MKFIGEGLIMILLGFTLILGINFRTVPPSQLKDRFFLHGVKETGAINLASAIYLGYRAFDTLGETVVLLLAVSGVAAVLGVKK